MSKASLRGAFVWHELLTSDPEQAVDFYRKVAGWTTQSWPNDPSYLMFVGSGGPVGGVMTLPDEAKAMGTPPNWLSYVGTSSVDGTARQVEQLGGRVLRRPDGIPGAGRFAILEDPLGAAFAVYTPSKPPPPRSAMALGEFSWHELATSDLPAAFEFYRALFGWEKTKALDMGPEMGIYQMFGMGGRTLGGMYRKPASMPFPPFWLPYAKVADSKRAAGLVERLGGQILNGPMEVPGGSWIAMGLDPQGAAFAVHSVKAAVPAKKPPVLQIVKPAKKKAAAKPARRTAKPAKKKAARKAAGKPVRKAAKPARRKAARKPARRAPAKVARRPKKK